MNKRERDMQYNNKLYFFNQWVESNKTFMHIHILIYKTDDETGV